MTDAEQPIDLKIEQTNQRLKMAQMGLQVERRGQKLNLRGTLPPRPDGDRLRPYQQRISLGLPATTAGLKQIEQQAKIIAAQLIQNTFDWRDYLDPSKGGNLNAATLPEKIQAFERHFLAQPRRASHPASARTTWETAYAPYLRKLQTIAQTHPNLTLVEAIYATLRSTDPSSRSRQVCCTAMGALADFLELALPQELKNFWGSYSPNHTQSRNLPSDELIVQTYTQIPNLAWRFVYGVMAAYGLRNHEVFFCDYSALLSGCKDATVQVLSTTKTGSHEVWPFYPEWVEQFQLRNICLPSLNTDLSQTTLQRVGQQVTLQFRRYQLPFSPYDLRHAWAVRTIHFGLPDTVAARMMGHSVAIHTRTYHQWITRRDQQQAVETALSKSQLVAPSVSREER
ncbi:MAG: site-specific integrase [Scytolyngbya sp. HA4215-MV1]|jgi:integrase|nr:site-specific integrase [Scytolyngbya sp. HA4215-MV1]